jgi:8-oxo-dGTP pyrophosphatase MutT (NUDIX family)
LAQNRTVVTGGKFQVAVGALLWRASDRRYLILRRSPDKDFAAGMWDSVTGRLDQGEGIIDALHREVREELGIVARTDFIVGTFRFYRGAPHSGNEMVGLHFCCSFDETQELRLSWEHSESRWVTLDEADALLPAGHWLRSVIARADALRALMAPELIQRRHADGFGL